MTFGSGGISELPLPYGSEPSSPGIPDIFLTTGIAVQHDGKIVISGQYNRKFSLVRLKSNGSLDGSFFDHGLFSDWIEGSYGAAWDVLVDTFGRIVASGGKIDGTFALIRIEQGR